MSDNSLTLIELNQKIKSSLEHTFNSTVWLVAEINSINKHRSGHCYLEFIQKAKDYDQIIAKTRATIWATQYRMIESYFYSVTGSELQEGLKVMVRVSVDFHELYGLSLNVRDIEPSFTLGDLERHKKEIIDKLKSEGVIDMNKELELPLAIQKIAVISSSGAAGYEDFVHQLNKNKYEYGFSTSLFEADMQGKRTEETIVQALSDIFDSEKEFDIVAILRGGGSKSDLSFFDNYNIAYHITQIPIPVITGIGHDRDESVTDMVAHTKVKTPTAAANFVIDHNLLFESEIIELGDEIIQQVKDNIKTNDLYLTNLSMGIHRTKKIINEKQENCNRLFYRISNLAKQKINESGNNLQSKQSRIQNMPKVMLKQHEAELKGIQNRIKSGISYSFEKTSRELDMFEKNIKLVDPTNVLKRGFSITKHNGKVISKTTKVKAGDEIETVLEGKTITSTINSKK